MIAQKTVSLKLPTKMSDEQFIGKSKDLAHALEARQECIDKIDRAKSNLKMIKDLQQPNIDKFDKEIYGLQLDLNRNHIIDEVECVEIRNYDSGVAHYRRIDNNEIVPGRFRKMSQQELSELPLDETKGQHLVPAGFEAHDLKMLKAFLIGIFQKARLKKEELDKAALIRDLLCDNDAFDEDTKQRIENAEYEIIDQGPDEQPEPKEDTDDAGQTTEATQEEGAAGTGTLATGEGESGNAGAGETNSESVEETPAA